MRIDKTFLPLMCSLALVSRAADLGVFESSQDIGKPSKTGSVEFDRAAGTYVIAGGGENMWFTNDAFHFAWTRVSGDFGLRAAVEWLGTGGNAHRKACLLVRQTLDADSAYVDVALHGDGLTSLQYRSTRGGPTREVQANEKGLRWAGLQREGNTFYMLLGTNADSLYPSGSFIRVQFTDPVYLGLGVCAHDDRALEKAQFSAVEVKRGPVGSGERKALHCALETVSISSKDRKVVFHTRDLIEAPNWTVDGKSLIYNSKGRLYRIPVSGGAPLLVDTGFATRCNNDHGLSPDGTLLVISDQSQGAGKSLIYTLPSAGGVPKLITPTGPSYWHGWSPDASTLAYCAERNGEYDVYTIPASGGQETRLTTAKGLDDGPEYSPDGKLIYFNSDRTGQMQIWRMRADGTLQEQVTSDEFNNWFPHPSPDGKWLAFLSYEKDVTGHPANKPVKLRLMPLAGGPVQELASLFGGQGTINVPSWSPDSRQLAFVSYELLSQ